MVADDPTKDNESNALQSIEGAGIEPRSRASRMRRISMSSSTRSRYLVVFFTFSQGRTTCRWSVNPFRKYVSRIVPQYGELRSSHAGRTGGDLNSGVYPCCRRLPIRHVCQKEFQRGLFFHLAHSSPNPP